VLDCRLNDPNVSVELRIKNHSKEFQRVDLHTENFVKQNGQNFTITGLKSTQYSFQCRAAGLKKEVKFQRPTGLKQ